MKIFCKIFLALIFTVSLTHSIFAQTEREKAIELYEKGDYPAAIEVLQKVTEADKKDGIAWRFLGMAYARTKNLKKAGKAFDKAADFKEEALNKFYDTPLKFISKPNPRYTDAARMNSITGKIKIVVEFGSDGKIRHLFPFTGLPYGLTENAINAAKEIKFEPAIENDKSVTVIRFVEYNFMIY